LEMSATQAFPLHDWHTLQVLLQVMVPPHPSGAVPHAWPVGQVVAGVHPQTFGVPPPPHVCGLVQLPQVSVPPQPSDTVPQFRPSCAQVLGVQAHLPFTQVEVELQVCPQAPQFALSVLVLVHTPPQHVVPEGHLFPQAPQLLLVVVLVQVPKQFVVPEGQVQVPELAEHTQPFGAKTQTPLQHPSPVQHDALLEQGPPAETHLLEGAVGDGAAPAAGSFSARAGKTDPASVAARILSAPRRERGVANFFARSSKCSALMPLSDCLPFRVTSGARRQVSFGEKSRPGCVDFLWKSDPKGSRK
jgi:hypothetical protein